MSGEPLGDLANHEHVLSAIGDSVPCVRPTEVLLLAGIRTFKSLFAAVLGVYASQTCNVDSLGHGEIPRVSIVSVKMDLAQVINQHLVGNLQAKHLLRELLVKDPTSDTVVLRHPSGRHVEIKVVAGARAGSSLVARWSAGCIFDEAPRMLGNDEAVINLSDERAAVLGRLLPGAQILYIGSPWAPYGPAWDMLQRGFLNPTKELVVVKAQAHWLNPVWWTEERREALRKSDPDVYKTDVLADFHDPEESLFPSAVVDACIRSQLWLDYQAGWDYYAAMDPATRGNAWTLVITTKLPDGRKSVAFASQWQGSQAEPLSPDFVLSEIAAHCKRYRVTTVTTDQYAGDALRDIAAKYDLYTIIEPWTSKNKVEVFSRLKTEIGNGSFELPPDPKFRADLLGVKRRVTQNGIQIAFTKTPDGRHCDYAPSLALSAANLFDDPTEQAPPYGTIDRLEWEDRKREEEDAAPDDKEWWEK